MRTCYDVIDEMLGEIPHSNVDLIKALYRDQQDSIYRAPEDMSMWYRVSDTLRWQLALKEVWEWRVLNIFTGICVDNLQWTVKRTNDVLNR